MQATMGKHDFRHAAARTFSSAENSTAQKAKTSSSKSMPSISAPVMALAIFGGAMAARFWYSSTLDGDYGLLSSITGAPRQDQSKVTIVLPQSVTTSSNRGKSSKSDASVSSLLLRVDREDLQIFLQTQQQNLEVQKEAAKEVTQQMLHRHLEEALQDCQTRGVRQFASWYFSYTTTYRLLSIAMKSAAKHSISIGQQHEQSLQQAVTRDLQLYICEKYQAMVLRPAVTDPKVRRALVATLEDLHSQIYQATMKRLEQAMQQYAQGHEENFMMASQSDHSDKSTSNSSSSLSFSIPPGSITLELDWRAQLQKAQHLPMAYEKNPPEFSVALIGGSAVAGKAMGGTAVKAVSAKLAAPFATKAVGTTLGGKAAAGAAGGMVAGGPLGVAMGAAIGVGMDMAVNKGVSLMQRSAFEKDVRESLDATLLEWEERMLPEVNRVVQEEWFGQLESMIQLKDDEKE
jgi:hypothetical protein